MSFAAGGWVYEQAVGSPAKKLVLLVLSEHYNRETKVTYPSVARMSLIAECDERTVRKALKELAEVGHIADSGRRTGKQQNVVVWKMPMFEAHISAKPANPDKNVGVGDQESSGGAQPPEAAGDSGGSSTGNAQPLQNCQGSAQSGDVPREATLTKMSSNPDIFAPATPTKLSGESSPENPLLTSGGAQTPPRAIPTGSRGAALDAHGKPFDAASSLAYWWNYTLNVVLGQASAYGICPFRSQKITDLPLEPRVFMRDVIREVTDAAVDEEQRTFPDNTRHRKRIETEIEARITRDLRQFQPKAPAERAGAKAAA